MDAPTYERGGRDLHLDCPPANEYRLPVVPQPVDDETIASWFKRLSRAYDLSTRELEKALSHWVPEASNFLIHNNSGESVLKSLEALCWLSDGELTQRVFSSSDWTRYETRYLEVCPICCLEDMAELGTICFRRRWCSKSYICCEKHHCPLKTWDSNMAFRGHGVEAWVMKAMTYLEPFKVVANSLLLLQQTLSRDTGYFSRPSNFHILRDAMNLLKSCCGSRLSSAKRLSYAWVPGFLACDENAWNFFFKEIGPWAKTSGSEMSEVREAERHRFFLLVGAWLVVLVHDKRWTQIEKIMPPKKCGELYELARHWVPWRLSPLASGLRSAFCLKNHRL